MAIYASDTTSRPLNISNIAAWKTILIRLALEFICYGGSLCIFGSHSFTDSSAAFYVIQIPDPDSTNQAYLVFLAHLDIVTSVTRNFNFVMSDAVLIWRAWNLWSDNRLVKRVLSVCMCGSIVGGIAECAWIYRDSSIIVGTENAAQYLIRIIPLLATNIVATSLIGMKVWYHRRIIQGALGLFTQKTQAEKVLMLLLESGVAYCLLWVVICATDVLIGEIEFSAATYLGAASYHIAVSQALRFADSLGAQGRRGDEGSSTSFPKTEDLSVMDDGVERQTHSRRVSDGHDDQRSESILEMERA
ncbi:hypothetical protein K525DRAFT_250062 [Schizophyllum commune Loenen D]|nr:hypothetical protein K525DRAFT_250062 [Schizophyllum commune Loenen D]